MFAKGGMIKTDGPYYQAVQEDDDTWSVVDIETDLAHWIDGAPMVLLTEELALALADFLNLDAKNQTIH